MRDNGKKKERMAKQKEGVREVSKMKKKKGWGGGGEKLLLPNYD